MSALLELRNIIIKPDETVILDLPEMDILEGEVLVILGPNGAGKSTLLQVAAGLKKTDTGTVAFPKHQHLSSQEYRRMVSTIFQSPLLLSDTVENNIGIGLKFRGFHNAEIKKRVNYWMDQLHISQLAKRRANTLSGGEAQRVSLARAFCLETELILMDEPFSSVDTPTRQELLGELRQIFAKTDQTCIYVTHDLDEALAIADRIAVFFNGKMHQIDTAVNVFTHPQTPEVAAFMGVENIIPGKVFSNLEGLLQIKANGSVLEAIGDASIGASVYVCLRPEDITLYNVDQESKPSTARNRLNCKITQMVYQGPLIRIQLESGFHLTALVTRPSANEMNLSVGKEVQAVFKASAIHLIETA